MKKTFYILLFLFIQTILVPMGLTGLVYSQSGWVQQSPLPTGENLFSIYFPDKMNGFIVGLNGTIIKTNNAGYNWIKVYSGTNLLLKNTFFIERKI